MERRDFLKAGAMGALAGVLPAQAAVAASGPGSGDAAFTALLDDLFFARLDLSPQSATANGFDKDSRALLKSRLDDRSKAAVDKGVAWHREVLSRVSASSPSALSEPLRRAREVVIWYQQAALGHARFGLANPQQPYPLSQRDGAYFELPDFLDSRHTIATPADAEAYLARLEALPRAMDQDSARQQELSARGLIAPGWALDMALRQLQALRKPAPLDSSLATSIDRRAGARGIAGNWGGRAASIVASQVYPAIDRQIAYIESLKEITPPGDGIWRAKDGDAIYAAALAAATTTRMSPEEIHKVGLAQVADLSAQLDKVLAEAGLTLGTVGERLAELNSRPEQLYPNTDEGRADLLESLNAGIAAMRTLLPRAFNDVPNDPLEIRRVPPAIQDGAPNGYYYRAALDGSRPAIYWINLRDTADWPKYGLPDLTYHEGVPGHHLQLSYVKQAGQLPLLVRTQGNSAYTEGWALYAEELASDLDAFSGLERAGYLQSLLFRAARLVVDTGIHAKRWSREAATDYMVANTGFTRGRSQSEVERYCAMIGQACSYKIGHNTWHRLREQARKDLGDKFSLGWFHDVLKEGILPLALLETRVNQRIAERTAKHEAG